MERVRISASELRGILATLAPQAGSRGESRRPAPGPGLPAPPPSPPLPPPRSVRGAPEPPPLPPTLGAGAEGGPSPFYQPESRCGVGLCQLRPLRASPAQVPASAPFLTAKVTVPHCLSPLTGFSAVRGRGKEWAPGSGGGPRGAWFLEESSVGLPRRFFSVGRSWEHRGERFNSLGLPC